jgi:hypothetical protein
MSRRRAVGSSRWHPFLRPCCRGLVGGPIFLGLLRWALIGLEDDHIAIRGPWARATFDRSSTKKALGANACGLGGGSRGRR